MFTPYWEEEGRHSYLFEHFSMRLPNSSRTIHYTSFSGAMDGFRTDAFRFPETCYTIIIFDNSEQYNHWKMAPGIYKILMNMPYENPLKSASKYLCNIALTDGITAALKEHDNIRENSLDEYDFRFLEHEINNYAYRYTKLCRMFYAETLHKMNTRFFPDSPDAWNSLGQTYALLGKNDLSREAFAKSNEIKNLEDDMIALITQKKYKDAEEKIVRIKQETPDRAVFTSSRIGPLLGEAYSSHLYDHAINICSLWMLGNPKKVGPYFSMARVYVKIGKTEEAAACYPKGNRVISWTICRCGKKGT